MRTYAVVRVSDSTLVNVHPWAVVALNPNETEQSPSELVVRVATYAGAKAIADGLQAV